jgi:hypothetical protein
LIVRPQTKLEQFANQDAICRLYRVAHDIAGKPPAMPGVFPDHPAPVVRNADGERELIMIRWDAIADTPDCRWAYVSK